MSELSACLNVFLRLQGTRTIFCCFCFENKVKGEQAVLLNAVFWMEFWTASLAFRGIWFSNEPRGGAEKPCLLTPRKTWFLYRKISKTPWKITSARMGKRTWVYNAQTPREVLSHTASLTKHCTLFISLQQCYVASICCNSLATPKQESKKQNCILNHIPVHSPVQLMSESRFVLRQYTSHWNLNELVFQSAICHPGRNFWQTDCDK